MNSREFARAWLNKHGLFDKDSDYDGWLGEKVMEIVEFIAQQGHSGGSLWRSMAVLSQIYTEYDDGESPIWQEYWESDEGKKIREEHR